MARPMRIEFRGAVYHVTSRGNARQAIFLDDIDHIAFLEVLCRVVEKFNFIVHAYCMMSNHYHLLLETPDGNLSRGMRHLNGVYTQIFNIRHNRVGHVLQGRYKAILVDKDSYLLELARYIVLNPVRAGIVKNPGNWKWSSYRATADYEKAIPCLTTDWIHSQFVGKRAKASNRYIEFVRAGAEKESPLRAVKGQFILGTESFIAEIKLLMKGKEKIKEIPRVQRYISRPSLNKILAHKDKKSKGKAMYKAHVKYGYTLKEIAEYYGVHYTTVSRAVQKI
ncbi:addiction module toxin RelE [bacterium SM23_31]|nr:MAG: addiction module toxin RelE [bacterium SM23_31]